MATKKKAKKTSTKSKKKTAGKKPAPAKQAKRPVKAKKKKTVLKITKTPSAPKKTTPKKKVTGVKPPRKKAWPVGTPASLPNIAGSRSGGHAGDLQGLSRREAADSESVDELIEEGNAFEADAVMGVENADNADEQEVRTHEVPEDDVPGEYLDEE
jgi:hypothetical protein